jgi:hypothetical protein
MDSSTIKRLLEDELARGERFSNWHGFTPENLRSCLVEPFAVQVDPDDLETSPRMMWVVLQLSRKPTEAYRIVYDPLSKQWAVVEHVKDNEYVAIIFASSLAGALTAM